MALAFSVAAMSIDYRIRIRKLSSAPLVLKRTSRPRCLIDDSNRNWSNNKRFIVANANIYIYTDTYKHLRRIVQYMSIDLRWLSLNSIIPCQLNGHKWEKHENAWKHLKWNNGKPVLIVGVTLAKVIATQFQLQLQLQFTTFHHGCNWAAFGNVPH